MSDLTPNEKIADLLEQHFLYPDLPANPEADVLEADVDWLCDAVDCGFRTGVVDDSSSTSAQYTHYAAVIRRWLAEKGIEL